MNHNDLIRHLTCYVDTSIKDFGQKYGRQYLDRSLAMWREVYGQAIAEHMKSIINTRLEKALP